MINTLSILISLLAVGYVVVRAAMLDKMLPWFKPIPPRLIEEAKPKRRRRGAPAVVANAPNRIQAPIP